MPCQELVSFIDRIKVGPRGLVGGKGGVWGVWGGELGDITRLGMDDEDVHVVV
jgi:hypothetical protein